MSFNEDMDTSVKPPASLIKIDIDDVTKSSDSFFWHTDRMFRAQFTPQALKPTDVDIKTLSTHPLFRTALGELVFPFDLQCIELDVKATGRYIDPDVTIIVEFQDCMDESIEPLTSEMNIYLDHGLTMPDSIAWVDSTHLQIEFSQAALGDPDIDIELPAATDNLRCLQGSVIPKFRIDDLTWP